MSDIPNERERASKQWHTWRRRREIAQERDARRTAEWMVYRVVGEELVSWAEFRYGADHFQYLDVFHGPEWWHYSYQTGQWYRAEERWYGEYGYTLVRSTPPVLLFAR